MTLLALYLLTATAPDPTRQLAHCLAQKDRACLTAILHKPAAHPSPEFLSAASRAYIFLNRPKDALDAIGQALEQQPESYDYLMERGWIYQKLGDQTSAIHSFLLAAKVQPRTPATFYELGMSFFLLEEYQRAQPHFQKVLELEPTNDKAVFMLGILDIMADEESDAKARFEKALELQPKNPHYLLHYGVLLNKFGETDKGIEFMLRAESLDPGNPLTHYNIGRAYLSEGKLVPARDELEKSIRLRSTLTPAFYKLNTIYRALGDPVKARAMLKRYQELQQQDNKEDDDPTNTSLMKP